MYKLMIHEMETYHRMSGKRYSLIYIVIYSKKDIELRSILNTM